MPRKYRYEKRVRAMFCLEDKGYCTPCWIWKRAIDTRGYGIRGRNGFDSSLVHLQFWEMINGKCPVGHELDHVCRRRDCVRPDHLEAVTHQINVQRGLSAKLSKEEVLEILRLSAEGHSSRYLGRKFGVSKTQILKIRYGVAWAVNQIPAPDAQEPAYDRSNPDITDDDLGF